ncbi:DUF262 domain-containing protein [Aggregatibacter actinomycetemcomitans]|nr:DUF262 domain-containing protein [Aggregatibacter actinomycetemcomitans]QEH49804.1 DUF262 domain-containing protein [Aggregatibacter actinomycetemcomitans]
MMTQLTPSVTNPTISDTYEKIQSGRLNLQPDFQRRFVWTPEHQEEFIGTILKGFPFPEIYVCTDEYDFENMRTSQKVIDGQQRLTTIRNYISGDYEFSFKELKPFAQLSQSEKKNFMSYQLVVRDIGYVDDSVVKEIFRRINLTKFKLEDIEIHNAVYDGEFIQVAKRVLKNLDGDLLKVFRESELTRMADLYFILQVMSTIENEGYYNLDKELENNISQYNDEYYNSSYMFDWIMKVFSILKDLNLDDDSIWFRKSNFFTLLVELISYLKSRGDLSRFDIKEKLIKFESNILSNKGNKDNDFGWYYSVMYTGTNSRKARVDRGELFRKYIFE